MKNSLFVFLTLFTLSCHSQNKSMESTSHVDIEAQQSDVQIGQYVVETFQDSKGFLWFGTLEKGVARYDGKSLRYFRTEDGLPSNRVVVVQEDGSGNLWFGTGAGISKYDGNKFTNYSEKDGLCSNMVSNLHIDNKGVFWIATWGGVCTFNGTEFEDFPIPKAEVDTYINPDTQDWVTAIMEDSKGNIWFGRDGYGATKYDGNSFVHITTKNGLNSNHVQTILEDQKGHFWIGTRVAEKDMVDAQEKIGKGGLNRYDGEKMIHFAEIKGLSHDDVYTLYQDDQGHLWISTISHGCYKYDRHEFTHYEIPMASMSFLKDRSGNMWIGCSSGLYRIDPKGEIQNIKTHGPWKS